MCIVYHLLEDGLQYKPQSHKPVLYIYDTLYINQERANKILWFINHPNNPPNINCTTMSTAHKLSDVLLTNFNPIFMK